MLLSNYFRKYVVCLAQVVVCAAQLPETGRTVTIPPLRTLVNIGGQPVGISVWGTVTPAPSDVFHLAVTVDIGELQPNLTVLLKPQIERSERCGERLTLNQAALAPAPPRAVLTAEVHYERFTCVKAFGKEIVKRLAGGNAILEVNLTPTLSENRTLLHPEVRRIDADGSLGEILQAGSFGDSIRQKIAASIESAIQRSTNLRSALPAGIGDGASVRSAVFADGGSGRLWVAIAGDVRLSPDQYHALARSAAH